MPLSSVQFLELVFNMKPRCVYDLQKANWIMSQPLGIFFNDLCCIYSSTLCLQCPQLELSH